MTRQLKNFFDWFDIETTSVRIKRHPQTEFLINSTAPARIIVRRNTAAVDKNVELSQILGPASQPVEEPSEAPIEQPVEEPVGERTVHPARIVCRRFTTAVDGRSPQLNASPSGIISHDPRTIVFADIGTTFVDIQPNITTPTPTPTSTHPHLHQSNAGAVAIQQSNSPDLITVVERRHVNRPLPELIPIRRAQNKNASNDSDGAIPNLAQNPIEYAAYLENRLFGVNGALLKSANVKK